MCSIWCLFCSVILVLPVKQKAINELRMHCWKRGNKWGIQPLLPLFPNHKSSPFSLTLFISIIKSTIPPFSGPSLCGKAKHICEWHHKLRYIPLQPRHLPAHRHRLSEESAGHVVVSWSSFFEGICPCVPVPFILFLWFSSFVLFPPSHDFCFLTQSSDIHMMGKLVRLGCTA